MDWSTAPVIFRCNWQLRQRVLTVLRYDNCLARRATPCYRLATRLYHDIFAAVLAVEPEMLDRESNEQETQQCAADGCVAFEHILRATWAFHKIHLSLQLTSAVTGLAVGGFTCPSRHGSQSDQFGEPAAPEWCVQTFCACCGRGNTGIDTNDRVSSLPMRGVLPRTSHQQISIGHVGSSGDGETDATLASSVFRPEHRHNRPIRACVGVCSCAELLICAPQRPARPSPPVPKEAVDIRRCRERSDATPIVPHRRREGNWKVWAAFLSSSRSRASYTDWRTAEPMYRLQECDRAE